MAAVRQVLAAKGWGVHTIQEGCKVYDAIARMVQHDVGSLVVMRGEVPRGVITERDYLKRVALEGRTSKTTRVEEIMSSEIVYVDLETDIEECMWLMTRRRCRHLPVTQGSRVVGLVSIGDIVKFLAREREATIWELTRYIQGPHVSPEVLEQHN